MRKSFRFRKKYRRGPEPARYKINEKITAPELRVVDEQGENAGVMKTTDALARAKELGLDLIEVSPKAEPPVAKILSYGSFKYQEEKTKAKAKAKQKKVDVKGIRLSLQIGKGDRDMRLKKAQEFFDDGHKVRIELQMRGRQRQHWSIAREIIEKFVKDLGDDIVIEAPVTQAGARISTTIFRKS
jgi:translation initiation factor IF-3